MIYAVSNVPGYGWKALPYGGKAGKKYGPQRHCISAARRKPFISGCLASAMWAVLEERTLREELRGYGAYMAQVRYRLIPRVW